MAPYIPLLLVLTIVAVILRQTTVLTILYLIAGIYLAGRFWSQRALRNIVVERRFNQRAFLDQRVTVRVTVRNRGWLPVVWMRLHESLPVGLAAPNYFQQVISLGGHAEQSFEYRINARKRGYYLIGPLFLHSGDLLGLSGEHRIEVRADRLIVYPRIVPSTLIRLPSRSPFGSIRAANPLFEDPSRTIGKRDYQTGDSLRRLDWKATAAVGRLQVRQFEPSIALETVIYLNMDLDDYPTRRRVDLVELAIVAAASFSSWSTRQKHAVGFVSNGTDPLAVDHCVQPMAPHAGSGHLTQILDTLARIDVSSKTPFLQTLRSTSAILPWGTTLVIITGRLDEDLLRELFPIRRRGLNAVLVPVGPVRDFSGQKRKAERFGFSVRPIQTLHDLERW